VGLSTKGRREGRPILVTPEGTSHGKIRRVGEARGQGPGQRADRVRRADGVEGTSGGPRTAKGTDRRGGDGGRRPQRVHREHDVEGGGGSSSSVSLGNGAGQLLDCGSTDHLHMHSP